MGTVRAPSDPDEAKGAVGFTKFTLNPRGAWHKEEIVVCLCHALATRRTTMMLGNGTTRKYAFDNRGQLTTQIEASGATNLFTMVDGYDAVGNRITRNFNGSLITWTYDDLYRLTGQQKAGQACTYTLDGVGNFKTMWEGGGLLDVPRTFTFNAAEA